MRRVQAFVLLLLAACLTLAAVKRPDLSAISAIRPEEIRKHIDFLAADSLLGRDTPSPQLDLAADYIRTQFKEDGLLPLGEQYFQTFKLNLVHLGEENYVKLAQPGKPTLSLKIKREFMPFEFTADGEAEGKLVFAGYGVTAPEYGYDDYADVDVKGKIVLVLKHEPGEKDPESPFAGEKPTTHSSVRAKFDNAVAHGAAGLLVVTDPLNHRSLRPRGFPWPSLFRNIPDDALPYTLVLSEKTRIPVVQVGKHFLRAVFGSVDSVKAIQQQIDSSLTPHSFVIADARVSLRTSTRVESARTQNVVAYLEGSDPKLRDEAIVIGAHYDHVGYVHGPRKPGEDYIYNGADDNASGTVGLLEVAKAFSLARVRPRRSVIFIAFAGEEKGLFGSRYYVENPLWPLAKTRAMLNMDMIGRNEGDRVTIIGHTWSPTLKQINEEENRYVGMQLDYNGEQFFRRSDQYSFARKGVPVLMYHTGEHPDYHKVSDNPDKIKEGKIAMIARLVFRTAWHAANTDQVFETKKVN
ncbi:MAG: M20/M25/M40 family metallo-hydrolase [Calditrichaeota bacterium]|nr:MAG: M20/M25/M40 family metallo-hydrolase [Calditrichota bacterium]